MYTNLISAYLAHVGYVCKDNESPRVAFDRLMREDYHLLLHGSREFKSLLPVPRESESLLDAMARVLDEAGVQYSAYDSDVPTLVAALRLSPDETAELAERKAQAKKPTARDDDDDRWFSQEGRMR